MSSEVFAAREKNGIYIPRERYLQEEAEKKAMTEKIERLGADLEARDKVSFLSIWKQTVMLLMTEMRIFLQNL
jgi:hypothetical protein